MNKKFAIGFAAAFAAVSLFAQEAESAEAQETEAIGWTPVAVSLASPVQLPWGIGIWDVYGFDLGLFYNDIFELGGCQLGLANTTRGEAIGGVFGGLFNYADKNVYGLRAVLGANICDATLYGWDVGGFGLHRKICGADTELLGTMQEEVCGFTLGGLITLTEKETYGLAMAGLVNLTTVAYGCQFAGVYNQCDELHGCQIGFVNFARECPWGFQIGLVNIIMDNSVKVLPIVNAYF